MRAWDACNAPFPDLSGHVCYAGLDLASTTDIASLPALVRWGVAVRPADRFRVSGLESWWAWPDWRGVRDALGSVRREKATASK